MKPVLYVSHSKRGLFYYNDASARYRCVFPAEELIANGEQAHAIHFSQISKIKLTNYKKIIFHRPQFSLKLFYIVKAAKKNGIELWVDFDDLLFCPELSDASAAVQSGKMPAALAKKHAKRYLKALRLFSNYQVSTDELANQLKIRVSSKLKREDQQNCNIKVSYNRVPQRWVKQAEIIPFEERLEKKIIRYLPGTSHHKHDFAHVERFLAELLHNNPSYHLNIIGDLEFDYDKFPENQISTTPFQPFEQLPELINDSWVIIAPLVDNVFNRCKSGLKFWESGVFGIPVISSPLNDIERFENIGLCISDKLDEWQNFLITMESVENYSTASNHATKASQQAVFSQEQLNHKYLYIKLTSVFGPRWPSYLLNPTTKTRSSILSIKPSLLRSNTTSGEVLKQLEAEASIKTYQDKPASSNTIRKVRKLLNSPIDFFKDMKLFN